MATAPSRVKLTVKEYLAIERKSETKSEFYDGEMYAMSGASWPHSRITVNLLSRLDSQLEGKPCQVFNNDLRIHIAETGSYTYPDVVAVCSEPQFIDGEMDTLVNPSLIIEVLSPSTEAFDRGGKFACYRRIVSLKEYVLVSQDRMMVERYQRRGTSGEWLLTEYRRPDESLELNSIGCEVPLREIYARIELPPERDSESK